MFQSKTVTGIYECQPQTSKFPWVKGIITADGDAREEEAISGDESVHLEEGRLGMVAKEEVATLNRCPEDRGSVSRGS